jgi:hypothetical protein
MTPSRRLAKERGSIAVPRSLQLKRRRQDRCSNAAVYHLMRNSRDAQSQITQLLHIRNKVVLCAHFCTP